MNIAESPYKGSGQLTRQQFLFYEMRTTAKLMGTHMDDNSLLEKIISENLYQYPTEKTIKQIAGGCIARLHALNDAELVTAIAYDSHETAKQICLFAMMRQFRLIWDFMIIDFAVGMLMCFFSGYRNKMIWLRLGQRAH